MSSGPVALEEVLVAYENAGADCEPVTASEVAEELGCTRRTALNKLDELAERGDLRSKKVGARSRVWWRPAAASRSDGRAGRERDRERLEDELDEMYGRISDGFYALDDEWRFTYVSERADELIGTRDTNLVGKNIWDVFDDVVDTRLEEEYRTAMETQEPTSFEMYDEELDGWYEVHAYPSETGLPVYFQDITERKESQRKLEESERRYRTLVEHFPNGAVALVDEDLRYRTVGGNPIVASRTVDDLESRPVEEALPPKVADELVPRYEAAFEGESSAFEFEIDDRIYQIRIIPARNDEGDVFAALGMSQDVTDRKERDHELERALDLLERTERIADVGGWEIDVDTESVFWTDQTFELLGVSADEEPPLDEALDMYHEEDKPIVVSAVENALASGEAFDVEVRIRTDGGEIRWLRLQGVPETVDGEVVSFRGAAQDVTEKVERERELEERNDRLDSFASMLAHELRNPVTIGQIYSQQLPAGTDSETADYITEAFDRIEAMIDVMLVLTRGREAVGERTSVRLADVARDAWDQVDAPDATVEVELDHTVQGDETYLRHLFRNLFENSVEHGGSDATITVGDLPDVSASGGSTDESVGGFYVADDGPGIPVADRDAVFDPGFTTTAKEGGTGLGLAFVEKLADVYGWECTATESETGGARFEFTNVD